MGAVNMGKGWPLAFCLLIGLVVGTLFARPVGVVAGDKELEYTPPPYGTGLEVYDYKKVHLLINERATGPLAGIAKPIRDKIELRMRAMGLESVAARQIGAGTFVVDIVALDSPPASFGYINFSYHRGILYTTLHQLFSREAVVWQGQYVPVFTGMTRENFMRGFTDEGIDEFLNAYLKANQQASK